MEAKISKILIELTFERITPQVATKQLLDLFNVSDSLPLSECDYKDLRISVLGIEKDIRNGQYVMAGYKIQPLLQLIENMYQRQ